ncbi:hypothetical protein B0H19DRAFT_256725 [Mycena capillaripes]|nr:hypothetical protein B0H19DRAFT_256725 [Mycena capillaripes]
MGASYFLFRLLACGQRRPASFHSFLCTRSTGNLLFFPVCDHRDGFGHAIEHSWVLIDVDVPRDWIPELWVRPSVALVWTSDLLHKAISKLPVVHVAMDSSRNCFRDVHGVLDRETH